jgi:hypothetical protein
MPLFILVEHLFPNLTLLDLEFVIISPVYLTLIDFISLSVNLSHCHHDS